MAATVADIIRVMESLAPSSLAEDWDNPGLQVGHKDRLVRAITVALDPLPEVVAAACEQKSDLLITHHPLIFNPLKSLDLNTPVGAVIQKALQHGLAIFSAHTNFDSAAGGLNDILALKIGLENLIPLVPGRAARESGMCKLAVYVPSGYEQKVLDALFETAAGKIGDYSCCSFRNKGTGTFRPETGALPFIGKIGEISHTDEIRIEAVVPESDVSDIVAHIRKSHPYQTMAYDVYPLLSAERLPEGLGRVGELDRETDLQSFALRIKEILGLRAVKMTGKPDLPVRKAAVCTGSGSGLMRAFFASDAQVYISGDLRYHDARDAEAAGRGLVDIGHFASEHLMVKVLAQRLAEILSGTDVSVNACNLEYDPFIIL